MLKPETQYTYYFKNPNLMYCEAHNTLRISEDYEDAVHLEGLSQKDINTFIKFYFKHILEVVDDSPLMKSFKDVVEVTEPKEVNAE